MINWMYFPKNTPPDTLSVHVVHSFESVSSSIDSTMYQLKSDEVLAHVRPELEQLGFTVEKSKRNEDLVAVPVLFGQNGRVEKSFEADAYFEQYGYVIEVEAGRGVTNYQFLKDFFEACTISNVHKLCIAVRNVYRSSNDFEKVCRFFESLYASNRLNLPLSGILIIGY